MGVAEVREQIAEARRKVALKKSQIQEAKEKLEQAEGSLPQATQRALRQGAMAGIMGKQYRASVDRSKKDILGKKQILKDYTGELSRYEQESIVPVERDVIAYEAQVAEYEADQRAFETARKFYDKGVPVRFVEGKEREYLKKFYEQGAAADEARAFYSELTSKFNEQGMESLTDFEKKRFDVGIKKGILGWKDTQGTSNVLPEVKDLDTTFATKIEDITEKKNWLGKITGMVFDSGGIPSVSAANYTPQQDLKSSTALNNNVINVSSGVSSGVSTRDTSKLGARITGFFGTSSDIKVGHSEGYSTIQGKETYSALGFTKDIEGTRAEVGTSTFRGPTIQDIPTIEKIERAQYRGNLFSSKVPDIVIQSTKFRDLSKGLNDLSGKDLDIRLQQIRDVGGGVTKTMDNVTGETTYNVVSPTVGVGFGMNKRQVSIDKLDTKTQTGLYFSAVRERYIKKPVTKAAEFIGYPSEVTIPESKAIIYTPQFGTVQQGVTGYEQVTIPAKTIYPSKIVGEVVSGSTYFVPGVWGAEVALKYGELSAREGSFIKGGISFVKTYPVETAIVGTLGALKLGTGIAGVVPKSSLGGLSVKQYSRALEGTEKELAQLEKEPIRWLSIQEKGTGKVQLKGYQDTSSFAREVTLRGTIKKTEGGYKFIPESEGISTIGGSIKLGKKDISYLELQKFKAGSKTGSKPIGSIGDIQYFYQLSVSTSKPTGSTFALGKPSYFIKQSKLEALEKQFGKNVNIGGDVTKEVSNVVVFRLKPNVYLSVEPERSLGLTLIKEKPSVDKFVNTISSGRKTSLATTFKQEQITAPVVIPSAPRITKPSNILEIGTTSDSLPSMVGGTGLRLEKSSYAGTGLYEQQSGVSIKTIQPNVAQIEKQNVIVSDNVIQNIAPKSSQIFKQKENLKTKQMILPAVKEQLKIKERQEQTPDTKLSLKTKQESSQIFKQKTQTKQTTRPKQSTTTTPKIKVPVKLPGLLSRLSKKVDEDGLFEAFVKKKGKEIGLGKFGTKTEAESVLRKKLVGTLSASGGISFGGKKIKSEQIDLGSEFRKSKVNPFLIVEKKQKRLRKSGTGQQVQSFRPTGKSKKKKSLFGGL